MSQSSCGPVTFTISSIRMYVAIHSITEFFIESTFSDSNQVKICNPYGLYKNYPTQLTLRPTYNALLWPSHSKPLTRYCLSRLIWFWIIRQSRSKTSTLQICSFLRSSQLHSFHIVPSGFLPWELREAEKFRRCNILDLRSHLEKGNSYRDILHLL